MIKKTTLTGTIFHVLLFCISQTIAQTPNEILGRITDHSVTASILFDQKVDLYIEYGTSSGSYPYTTAVISGQAGKPDHILLGGLPANTRCYYRTRYKAQGAATFSAGPERSFHTQRPPASTFTFTLESDEHLYDKKGVKSLYQICLNNQAADQPDFMMSLGDIFGDDHYPLTITSAQSDQLHKQYRPFLGTICHSVPFFICLGNHEGENNYYMGLNPPENLAVYSTLWRKYYYPNPFPDGFYGNTATEAYGIGNPENYYSWVWGDALFVVLDAYRYQCDTTAKPKNWAWTLGEQQYQWFKNALETSSSKYKFVFIHQLRGQGRGGVADAKFFEWGGYEGNGTVWGFATNRPGWTKPIHQLLVDNGVNILFHGHDHLFAHEVLDGVVYQELPMPCDSTYEIGMLANADAYVTDTIGGSGHLRVKVSPECVKVDFVRAYLPADTVSGLHHNREVAFSYSLGSCPSWGENEINQRSGISIYPNPAGDFATIRLPDSRTGVRISLTNSLGQEVLKSVSDKIDVRQLPVGLYMVHISSPGLEDHLKLVVRH
jgi:hypothetical protein